MRKDRTTLSLYNNIFRDMQREAKRLDRSVSWIAQKAWKIARHQIKKMVGE